MRDLTSRLRNLSPTERNRLVRVFSWPVTFCHKIHIGILYSRILSQQLMLSNRDFNGNDYESLLLLDASVSSRQRAASEEQVRLISFILSGVRKFCKWFLCFCVCFRFIGYLLMYIKVQRKQCRALKVSKVGWLKVILLAIYTLCMIFFILEGGDSNTEDIDFRQCAICLETYQNGALNLNDL